MKNLFKTLIISAALIGATGTAMAQETVDVESMNIYNSNLDPGYSEVIEMAEVPALDETIEMFPAFEKPNNFMSDAGVYRYAYFEKTGDWLTRAEAEQMMNDMN
jgi:hypothetical protein